MDDSILKKEFAKKDVERIRNLVTKKYGKAITTQVGYSKGKKTREENVPFEEDGKTWIIKDGIKQTITKLDDFKNLVKMPLLCPGCSKPMKTSYDKKMYVLNKICMNCTSEFETKLKIEGKYDEYSNNIMSGNLKHFLDDYENFLDTVTEDVKNDGFITEAGDVEKWVGANKNNIEEERKRLKDIRKNINPKEDI